MRDFYYGEETRRAAENFSIEYKKTDLRLIYAVADVKRAAALTYAEIDAENREMFRCIADICREISVGSFDGSFITSALQGGAGTSVNMNVNEVIANAASEALGRVVRPIDDANRGQSTNDVYPTALRIAAIRLVRSLSAECAALQESLQKKEQEFDGIKKLGRTELMDAVPITLGSEFGAYAQAISRDRWRIYKSEERLRFINLGGTAVGRYDNASRKYRYGVIERLREITGIGLAEAEYPMDITQNNDVFVEVSGLLKALSVNLVKIANDFRLMNSGPCGGFGEIRLAEMQKGSSIMPGKINPVIAESVIQCAFKVQSDDAAITSAASHGEFELNAFEPLIADCLLEELELLCGAVRMFRIKCVETLEANDERCAELLDGSYAFAASFVPKVGYEKTAEIIKSGKAPAEARKILEEAARGEAENV